MIAIENARLFNELRARTRRTRHNRLMSYARLVMSVRRSTRPLDLATVLSTIVSRAVQLSGTEAGTIYEFDDQQKELRLRSTYGMSEELIEALRDAAPRRRRTDYEPGCRLPRAGADRGSFG